MRSDWLGRTPGALGDAANMHENLPIRALTAPLAAAELEALTQALRPLVQWQLDLARFRVPAKAPDATPIVSIYVDGRMVGCAGTDEGEPEARLARAFVQALSDQRFGGIAPEARARVVAQVSYAHSLRRVPLEQALETLEVGLHGLALATPAARAALLPDVASEHRFGPESFLDALATKSGVRRTEWPEDGLYFFQTSRVVARMEEQSLPADPIVAAAEWLAQRVSERGEVSFGLEPSDGSCIAEPPFLHGRVAVLVRSLLEQSAGRGAAVRAKRWLEAEVSSALQGNPPGHFPKQAALVAGTLALCLLAGIDCGGKLRELALAPELLADPWVAAQVSAALGTAAPRELFAAAVRDLDSSSWAPWTLLAAEARGDRVIFERAAEGLVQAVRADAPHRGGVGPGVPEIARTAVTMECLCRVPSRAARNAVGRARQFLLEQQLFGASYARTPDPRWVSGAFPISPIQHFLQIDVTAHALSALVAGRSSRLAAEWQGAES
jgi:hypothetical protein